MAGRTPKPTALKKLAGNPGKRPLNQREPKLEPRMLSVPRFLSEEAKAEWRRVVHELYDAGLLTAADRAILTAYCHAWGMFVKAEKELKGQTLVLESSNGNKYQNPLVGIVNKARYDVKRFAAEFGMTPAARSKVQAEAPEEPDELESLLFGGKNVRVQK